MEESTDSDEAMTFASPLGPSKVIDSFHTHPSGACAVMVGRTIILTSGSVQEADGLQDLGEGFARFDVIRGVIYEIEVVDLLQVLVIADDCGANDRQDLLPYRQSWRLRRDFTRSLPRRLGRRAVRFGDPHIREPFDPLPVPNLGTF